MASTERTRRTAGLDGLRALAALSVLCLHVWLYARPDPAAPTRLEVLDQAAFELRLGLVFFFLLSGYLLYRAFAAAALRRAAPVDVGRYARRRFARIVPAYWLSIAGGGGGGPLSVGGRGGRRRRPPRGRAAPPARRWSPPARP